MNKLFGLVFGFGLGAAIGAVMVMIFAPTTGDQLVVNLKRGWQESMQEARKASQQRRQELEAELARMRSDSKLPLL
jgi:gas vesicle protein